MPGMVRVYPRKIAAAASGIDDAGLMLADGLTSLVTTLDTLGAPWGGDDLGRAFYEGAEGSVGFRSARDGLLDGIAQLTLALRGHALGAVRMAQNWAQADSWDNPRFGLAPAGQRSADSAALRKVVGAAAEGPARDAPPPPWYAEIGRLIQETVTGCRIPDGDSAGMRQLAEVFTAMADVIDNVTGTAGGHAAKITADNLGDDIDAFGSSFAELTGAGGGHLDDAARYCRGIAGYCRYMGTEIKAAETQFYASAGFLVVLWMGVRLIPWPSGGLPARVLALAETRLAALRLLAMLRTAEARAAAAGAGYVAGLNLVGQTTRISYGLQDGYDSDSFFEALALGAAGGAATGALYRWLSSAAGRGSLPAALLTESTGGRLIAHSAVNGGINIAGDIVGNALHHDGTVHWDKIRWTDDLLMGIGMGLHAEAMHSLKGSSATLPPDAQPDLESQPRTDRPTPDSPAGESGPPPRTVSGEPDPGQATELSAGSRQEPGSPPDAVGEPNPGHPDGDAGTAVRDKRVDPGSTVHLAPSTALSEKPASPPHDTTRVRPVAHADPVVHPPERNAVPPHATPEHLLPGKPDLSPRTEPAKPGAVRELSTDGSRELPRTHQTPAQAAVPAPTETTGVHFNDHDARTSPAKPAGTPATSAGTSGPPEAHAGRGAPYDPPPSHVTSAHSVAAQVPGDRSDGDPVSSAARGGTTAREASPDTVGTDHGGERTQPARAMDVPDSRHGDVGSPRQDSANPGAVHSAPAATYRERLQVVADKWREVLTIKVGTGRGHNFSKTELRAIVAEVDAITADYKKDGVDFSLIEFPAIIERLRKDDPVVIVVEGVGPYFVDYDGPMTRKNLIPADRVGLEVTETVVKVLKELAPNADIRVSSLYDDYNPKSATYPDGRPDIRFTAEKISEFRASIPERLAEVGAIPADAKEGKDFHLYQESKLTAGARDLVARLEEVGTIYSWNERIDHLSHNFVNPLHFRFGLHGKKWLCVTLDSVQLEALRRDVAATFDGTPEDLQVIKISAFADYMKTQQEQLGELVNALDTKVDNHALFYPPDGDPKVVASTIEKAFRAAMEQGKSLVVILGGVMVAFIVEDADPPQA